MNRFLVLFITLFLVSKSYAIDLYSHDINISTIRKHINISESDISKYHGRHIKVGVVDALSPYDIVSYRENTYKGLSADYLYVIKSLLSLNMEVVLYKNRMDAINAIKSGAIDILSTANGYEEHHGLLLSEPYRKDIVGLFSNSYKYSEPKKIGIYHEYLPYNEVKRKFPSSEIIEYKTPKEAILAVAYNYVDSVIMDLYSANYNKNSQHVNKLYFQNILDIETKGFSFAVKNSSDILDIINIIVRELNHVNFIGSRWNGGGVSVPDYETLKKSRSMVKLLLPDVKRLKVGLLKDAAPVSYLNDDNIPQGILIEFLELMEIYSGIDFDYWFTADVNKLENYLIKNKIDFSNLVFSRNRAEKLLFSKNIIISEYAKVVKKSNNKIGYKKLYLTKNNNLDSVVSKLSNETEVIYVNTYLDALEKVFNDDNGDSFAIVPLLSANFYISKHFKDYLSIERVYEGVPAATLNFVVDSSNDDIERFLSFMISIIPDNDINLISNRWQKNALPELKTWIDFKETLYIILVAVTLFVAFIFSGTFLIIKSYKKRLEIKGRLQEQLNFMQIIVDSMPYPVYAKDEDLNIIISNNKFKSLEGLFYEEGILKSEIEIIDEDYIVSMLNNQPIIKERGFFFDEKRIYVYHWIQPFQINNKKGVICGWLDITEKERLLEELSLAKESADSANRAKSHFVAMISHEIRTPISAILGFLEIFIKKYPEHQNYQVIEMALNSAKDLSNLIGDILDISKIESGSITLSPSSDDIKDLFKTLYQTYKIIANKKGITFDCFIDNDVSDFLYFDSMKLKQIMVNIIGNAIKFTEQGGITLRLSLEKKDKEYDYLSIILKDSGIGIPKKEITKIFDAFTQAKNHSGLGGTGLGLMISKRICDLMGANITIESMEGEGTTISINVKFNKANSQEKSVYLLETNQNFLTADLKILIVDDYLPNRCLLAHQLNYLGYSLKEAASAQEALLLFKDGSFDLIITDCNMPGMSGYELAKEVRKYEVEHDLPKVYILGFTANALTSEVDKCLLVGMDDCLFKPLSIDQLNKKILEVFEKKSNCVSSEIDRTRFNKLYSFVGEDDLALNQLLRKIVDENVKDIKEVERIIFEKDQSLYKSIVHRIKSVADMLDDENIRNICQKVTDEPDKEQRLNGLQELLSALKELNTYILHYLTCVSDSVA